MSDFRIGDRVVFRDRVCVVRGVSPMSVTPPVAHLVCAETGERFEVPPEELVRPERPERRPDAARWGRL